MTTRNFALSALAVVGLLSVTLLAGCGDQPTTTASTSPTAECSPQPACSGGAEASPAAMTTPVADAKMGPPAPPTPVADPASMPSTPFKGNGKPVTTASGLKYEDMTVGTGPSPKDGQRVRMQYVGTGEDGSVFDSSYKRGQPFEFVLGVGQVIKGWDEGVASMKVGGRRKLVVPPDLAYHGQPGMPFDSSKPITFDVTLESIAP